MKTISSTDNCCRDWLVPSSKRASRDVKLNGNFFTRSTFVKLFQCFILCVFKVTSLCFLSVVILNTTKERLSFTHLSYQI